MGNHHYLTHTAKNRKQFDGWNMRAGIHNGHIRNNRGVGECGQSARRRHEYRLGSSQNLRIVTANTTERHMGTTG